MFSSNAGAAEYVGASLGEFVRVGNYNNHSYYNYNFTRPSFWPLFIWMNIRSDGIGILLVVDVKLQARIR